MLTGSDSTPRSPRLAGEDGSASVEFLALSVILLVPLVYLMVFASQIQAAVRLTLSDYGVAEGAYEASLACDMSGCGSLEPGEVVEVRVAVELTPPLVPGSWLPQGLVTVDSSARARMPRY